MTKYSSQFIRISVCLSIKFCQCQVYAGKLFSLVGLQLVYMTALFSICMGPPYKYVTKFWKITHMGAREIIRISMFSGLLIRAGHSFKNISRIFL